jgi:hypothetical protein
LKNIGATSEAVENFEKRHFLEVLQNVKDRLVFVKKSFRTALPVEKHVPYTYYTAKC